MPRAGRRPPSSGTLGCTDAHVNGVTAMSAAASPVGEDRYWTTARVVIALLLGALAVAGLSYAGTHLNADRTTPAADGAMAVPGRGDCVTAQVVPATVGGARQVDCWSGQARYTVVQTFPASTDPNACADVPGSEFALLQRTSATGPVNVLCVEPLHVVPRWEGE